MVTTPKEERGKERTSVALEPTLRENLKCLSQKKMFSFVGDTVFDPFWGTGSTTLAAIKAVRSSIGIEIETKYIDTGSARLAQMDMTTPARLEFVS